MTKIIVTGAAGFIGSALCRYLRRNGLATVIGVDNMGYAANREALAMLAGDHDFRLIESDITDAAQMQAIIAEVQPDGIMHLAAETHVDRSIDSPGIFVQTNVVGTFTLLEATRSYLEAHPEQREAFRFLHVSTDEVYGSLGADGQFIEDLAYAPNSPYAASKAASDHLARAWYKTYGVPVVISNCSNNYGPFQFPEKLIPLIITKAQHGEKLPVYGQGLNVRDWLYVDDHAKLQKQLRLELAKRRRCPVTDPCVVAVSNDCFKSKHSQTQSITKIHIARLKDTYIEQWSEAATCS